MRYAIERHRLLAERTDDAHVFAALVRVGEALMAGLRSHAMLDRLCHVTAEVLDCDGHQHLGAGRGGRRLRAGRGQHARRIGTASPALRVPRAALSRCSTPAGGEQAVHWLDERLRQRAAGAAGAMPAGVDGRRVPDPAPRRRRSSARRCAAIAARRASGAACSSASRSGLVHVGRAGARQRAAGDRARAVERDQDVLRRHHVARAAQHGLCHRRLQRNAASRRCASAGVEANRLAQIIGERARESLQLIQAALEMTRSEVQPVAPDERELSLAELVEPLRREMDAALQRPRAGDRMASGPRAAGAAHRRGEVAHGAQEPGRQRDQVHRARRGAGARGPRRRSACA